MRLSEILLEDVSREASLKTIADILSTELPELYRKLAKMAERYYESNGELGKGFRFVSGGQKTQWYHNVFEKYLKSSLYNLANHTKSSELKEYLSKAVGNTSFSSIENVLFDLLGNIAKKNKIQSLLTAVSAAIHARDAYYKKLEDLEISDADDYEEPAANTPPQPNPVGQQNATAEAIINDILSRIDRTNAGEIRQILARSENKLQTLQRELSRRGLNP